MTASWKPDPTGRHQVRWWDGQNWTDHVADDGVTANDPYVAAPSAITPTPPPATPADTGQGTVVFAAQPAAPTTSGSAAAGVPTPPAATTPSPPVSNSGSAPSYLAGGPTSGAPVATTGSKKFPMVPVVIGVVVAIVLIVVLVFVVGGGGDDGPSSITGEIRDDELLAISISGDQGEVVVVEARPADDGDVVFGLLVTRDQLRDFYDEFAEVADSNRSFSDFESGFRSADDFDLGDLSSDFEDGYIIQEGDSGLDGDPESGWIVLPVDGEFAVVAFGFDGVEAGEVELSIERCGDTVAIEDLIDAEDTDEEYDLAQDACGDIRVPYNS